MDSSDFVFQTFQLRPIYIAYIHMCVHTDSRYKAMCVYVCKYNFSITLLYFRIFEYSAAF